MFLGQIDSLRAVAPGVAGAVFVSLVLILVVGFIVQLIVAPQSFMRFSVRYYMFFRTPAERERLVKKSDRLAYYYLGTAGESNRDTRIRRFDRVYGRGLGIAAVLGVLGMILFAVMHTLLS